MLALLWSRADKRHVISDSETRCRPIGLSSFDEPDDIVVGNGNPNGDARVIRTRRKVVIFRYGDFSPAAVTLKESKFSVRLSILRHKGGPPLSLPWQFQSHSGLSRWCLGNPIG